jgi:ATP phosphoribosyltransferase regulatory subunit
VHGKIEGAEQRQAGIELVGAAGPEADGEVIAALSRALAAAGVPDARVAVGSVAVVSAVLAGAGADDVTRDALWEALRGRSVVDWRRAASGLPLEGDAAAVIADLPALRGGVEVLDAIAAAVPSASDECDRLRAVVDVVVRHGVAAPMIDMGVVRDWAYYSGVVIEAYAAGAMAPVAVGGRYDGLGARFGRDRAAVGVAVALDLLHHAVGRGAEQADTGMVLVGGSDDLIAEATALRAQGVEVVGVPATYEQADALALADGRRFVVRRMGDGWSVRDVISGADEALAALESGPWT